jgi:hypothetical protein
MQERKILLDEFSFTNVCKFGFIKHLSPLGTTNIHISKRDIKDLFEGKMVIKEFTDETIKIAITNLDPVLVKEIIRRSPMFSDLYYEI